MGIKARVKSLFGFGAEGSVRGPFYGQSEFGNFFQLGPLEDGWQRGLSRDYVQANATAFSCRSLLAAMGAQLPIRIIREDEDGVRSEDKSSDSARVLRAPNEFMTGFEFREVFIMSLLSDGNAFALVRRNQRGGITGLIPLSSRSVHPYIVHDPEHGTQVFYAVSGSGFSDVDMLVPSRDVLHTRINASADQPLRGRSPLEHAAAAVGLNQTLNASLMAYHNRQQRIGALITADATLNSAQIQQLKAAWESVSRGWSMGGTCILPGGLRPVDVSQMGANVSDTVTLQILQANDKSIARVYRVPTELLNLDPAVGRSAEEAGRWLTLTCLGPLMENIEQSLTKLFGLDDAYSWVETDYSYVHRTSELDRWAAIEASVRAGVRSVNEARKLEGLPQVAGGSTPLVQMQDLPIGLASELGAATIERVRRESARNNPQAAPTEPGAPPAANDPQPEKTLSPNQIRERVSDRIRLITRSAL